MSELKPCPWCEKQPQMLIADKLFCCDHTAAMYPTQWNRRPIEDQLRKRIAKLEKVISLMPGPFACEDFHHDKKDRHKDGECPVRNRFEAALKACEEKEYDFWCDYCAGGNDKGEHTADCEGKEPTGE